MNPSPLLILGAALALTGASTGVGATEVGRVISSQQVVQPVGVPRRICSTEPMLMDTAPTGGGAVAGAVVGGLAGNAVGSGGGRAIATMLGFLAGSVIGDRIEASQPPRLFMVEYCAVHDFTENRTVGWDVEYEYAGKRYSTRLPNEPGPTIALDITPAGATPVSRAAVVTAPRSVYSGEDAASPYPPYPASAYPGPPYPAYGYSPAPVYAPRPNYVGPPVSIGLSFGWSGGHRGWR